MKKKCTPIVVGLIAAVIAAVALGPFVVPAIRPWSRINCRHEEIDLRTGRKRVSKYIWYMCVSQGVEETYLSETVPSSAAPDEADWQAVNTFSPWRKYSPPYAFHGALAQVRQLQLVLHLHDASEEDRVAAAKGLLAAWQGVRSDDNAESYLQELSQKFEQLEISTE